MSRGTAGAFVRGIDLPAAVSLVMGSMIGSGIFIVSAGIARQVQAPALLLAAWALTGVLTVIGALSQAELAAMDSDAGGQYAYLREGLGPLWGFLYGWTLFMVIQTGTIAAVAVAFARFTAVLVPGVSPEVFLPLGNFRAPGDVLFTLAGHPPAHPSIIVIGLSWQRLLAVATVVLLTWVNVQGVRTGAWIQTVLTAAKVLAMGALIVLGLTVGRHAGAIARNFGHFLEPTTPGLAVLPVLGAAMVGSLFSSSAWNNVTYAAAEVENPQRNLPLALLIGSLAVSAIYLLTNAAYLSMMPIEAIAAAPQDRVGTAAAQVLFGDAGAAIMAVAIMVSTFGCNNGLILAGARVYYAMAADGLFFRRAGALHPVHGTPTTALWAQAAWTSVLAFSGSYADLLNYVIFAAVLFYMLTVFALFRLRRLRPDAVRPYRAFGYPWLQVAYCLALTALMVDLLVVSPQYTWPGLIIVLLGVPVYLVWRRMGRRTAAA